MERQPPDLYKEINLRRVAVMAIWIACISYIPTTLLLIYALIVRDHGVATKGFVCAGIIVLCAGTWFAINKRRDAWMITTWCDPAYLNCSLASLPVNEYEPLAPIREFAVKELEIAARKLSIALTSLRIAMAKEKILREAQSRPRLQSNSPEDLQAEETSRAELEAAKQATLNAKRDAATARRWYLLVWRLFTKQGVSGLHVLRPDRKHPDEWKSATAFRKKIIEGELTPVPVTTTGT